MNYLIHSVYILVQLIDWTVIYAVPAIFQAYNDGLYNFFIVVKQHSMCYCVACIRICWHYRAENVTLVTVVFVVNNHIEYKINWIKRSVYSIHLGPLQYVMVVELQCFSVIFFIFIYEKLEERKHSSKIYSLTFSGFYHPSSC